MAGATRRPATLTGRDIRERGHAASGLRTERLPYALPRSINVAWLSITGDDLLVGELVFNRADNSFVYRKDETNIYRFNSDATRTV